MFNSRFNNHLLILWSHSDRRASGACPGYVVGCVISLECHGLDHPSSMQWQTIAESKAKDKLERRLASGVSWF